MTGTRVAALLLASAGLLWVGACARQGSPPGGPEDRRPPVVASVSPDTFAVVEPGSGRIRVRFNERISERPAGGSLADAVTISPRTGDIEVSHSRDAIDIELRGGFRPNTVYRVTIEPVIQDMFNNPMAVPFEWVFSTGPAFEENAIVGLAFDRVDGSASTAVSVQARRVRDDGTLDSVPQVARVDEEGIFAFRWLPRGRWEVEAFVDRNRDGEREAGDAFGVRRVVLAPPAAEPASADVVAPPDSATGDVPPAALPADTAEVLIPVLAWDTTAAVIARANFVDSTAIALEFDDWLDPSIPFETVGVRIAVDQELVDSIIAQDPESTLGEVAARARARMPSPLRLLDEEAWELRRDSLQVVEDSLRALRAQAAADSAAAAGDSIGAGGDPEAAEPAGGDPAAAAPPAGPPGGNPANAGPGGAQAEDEEPETLPDGSAFPYRRLWVVFSGPVPAEVPLRLELSGVWNLNGLAGNPGVSVRRVPPAPDSVAADSVPPGAMPADSAGAPPVADTAAVIPPDSAGGPPVIDAFRVARPLDPIRRRRP